MDFANGNNHIWGMISDYYLCTVFLTLGLHLQPISAEICALINWHNGKRKKVLRNQSGREHNGVTQTVAILKMHGVQLVCNETRGNTRAAEISF